MVELARLLNGIEVLETRGELPTQVDALSYNSRQIQPRALFVALRGTRTDGHRYIDDAYAAGATAAVVEEFPSQSLCPCIRVQSTLAALPALAAAFFDYPAESLALAAVTGSNGKTSSTYLIAAMWEAAGHPPAVIGTIQYRWKDQVRNAPNTTPLALDLQALLAEIRDDGVRHVVMEVSSHALRLHRVDGIRFHTGLWTNLTREHMDFHKDMDDYRESKAVLFSDYLRPDGIGVINTDDENGRIVFERLSSDRRLSFGLEPGVDVTATRYELALQGTTFQIATRSWKRTVRSVLLGEHNLRNLLGAAATGVALGLPADAVVEGLQAVKSIPGRLESIENTKGARILVDYAHTPDGLRQVLKTLAALPHRRLITVFGCGGDRDRTKRPVMGRIALEYSDQVLVTSDNPRTEEPMDIIREIEAGMTDHRDRYDVIPGRREAIARGLEAVGAEDILLVAGKGHEATQTIGTTAYPFDDRAVIRDLLAHAGW